MELFHLNLDVPHYWILSSILLYWGEGVGMEAGMAQSPPISVAQDPSSCGLSLFVLVLAPREVFLQVLHFFSIISKWKFDPEFKFMGLTVRCNPSWNKVDLLIFLGFCYIAHWTLVRVAFFFSRCVLEYVEIWWGKEEALYFMVICVHKCTGKVVTALVNFQNLRWLWIRFHHSFLNFAKCQISTC